MSIRVLAKDQQTHYRFGTVDRIDDGSGLMVWLQHSAEKVSRHSDGKTWIRTAGAGERTEPSIRVPFSNITREVVHAVQIPSDLTYRTKPFHGKTDNAFVFSSTVLNHNPTFAAELVDPTVLPAAMEEWRRNPRYVSAQTCSTGWGGKTLILTVLHDPAVPSSGAWRP